MNQRKENNEYELEPGPSEDNPYEWNFPSDTGAESRNAEVKPYKTLWRNSLREALKPFALAFKETNPVGSIPDDKIWIWKPSDNTRETNGISRADLKLASEVFSELNEALKWENLNKK